MPRVSSRPTVQPFHHVANGTSTTCMIEPAGIPGTHSIWADVLYEGPVPDGSSDDELLEVRSAFLGAADGSPTDPSHDLRRWRAAIAEHEAYAELVLWFEHDLFDQLNLLQLLTWIRTHVPSSKPVSLICIDAFPGRPRFRGLGELTPVELGSLFETREPVSAAAYDLAARGWDAFRRPAPDALDRMRRSDTSALPFLRAAIERFLQEYPWTSDGLARTERRLLQIAEAGPVRVLDAFPRMQDGETAYSCTDGTLVDLVATLSTTSPPLVTFTGDPASRATLRGTVALTDAGREVLEGRRDRVACGLDRWLGGVHLQSGTDIWRWDDEVKQITR